MPKPVTWRVRREGILDAIHWACKKLFHSIDRPGMNRRALTERLDDKIMGDVATVAVLQYLETLGVPAVAYDEVRKDRFQSPDPGWDVAIGSEALAWADRASDPTQPDGLTTASVRSSRLPRHDSLARAISIRDFKIFAPQRSCIEDCITAEIEMQVYYDHRRSQLGDRKIHRAHIGACIRDREQGAEIARRLAIEQRYGVCYLTAWNDKPSIVRHARTLPRPFWSSFGKRMWIAPLRLGKDVRELKKLR